MKKTLYVAGDTVWCDECAGTARAYRPSVIVLNCREATLPSGRLIMSLADISEVCRNAPEALVIASHLDSVNHALVGSDDVGKYVREKNLCQVRVPVNGEGYCVQQIEKHALAAGGDY